MAAELFSIVGKLVLDGIDTVKGQLTDVEGQAEKTSSGMSGTFGKIAPGVALGVGAAVTVIGGLGAAAYALGSNFDDAYDNIRTQTGATGDALNGLQDDFKQVVSNVPTSFADASTAVADLNQRLGITGQPLQDLSKQFINLSSVTGTDLTGNIKQASEVFGAWQISTQDQGGALDYLFKTSQQTGVGINDLMGNVQRFAPQLQSMGFSFEDSTALLGNWQQKGVDATAMLSGMSIGLATFAKEGKTDTKQALEEVVAQIQNAGSSSEATAIAMQTFGTRAGPAMAANIRKGALSIDDLEAAIKGSSETINAAEGDTEDFAQKWEVFKNRAMVALEPVGNAVFGLAGTLIDDLGPALIAGIAWLTMISAVVGEKVTPAINSLQGIFAAIFAFLSTDGKDAFTAIIGGVTSFLDSISPVTTFLQDNFGAVIAGLVAIILYVVVPAFVAWAGAAIAAASATIAALAPILLPLAAIGLAVGALYLLWSNNFLGIRDLTTAAFGAVLQYGQQFIGWFQDNVIPALQRVAAYFQEQFAPVIAEFPETLQQLQGAFEAVFGVITAIVTALWTGAIQPTFSAIASFLEAHSEQIEAVLSAAWLAIQTVVTSYITIIRDTIKLVMDLINGDWSAAWDDIKGILQAVWDAMKALIQLQIDAIKLLLSLAWDAIKIAAQAAWNGIKDLVNGIVTALANAIQAVVTDLKSWLDGLWGQIHDAANFAWSGVRDLVSGIVTDLKNRVVQLVTDAKLAIDGLWSQIHDAASNAWNGVKNLIVGIVTDTKNAITGTFNDAKASLDTTWTNIHTAASNAWNSVKQLFTDGKQAMQDAAMAPFNWFRDNVGGVVSSAVGKVKGPLNDIISGYQTLINGFASALNWIFSKLGIGGNFSAPQLPRLAQGTEYSQSGMYSIAERGAELVWIPGQGWSLVRNPTEMFLPEGARVIPAGRTQNAMLNSQTRPQTRGLGRGGLLDDALGAVGDVASGVASTVKDWMSKGAGWVVNAALDTTGIGNVSLPGVFSQTVGAFIGTVKDKLVKFVGDLIKGMNDKIDQQQAQAPVGGTDGVAYTGSNAVVSEAFRHLGETMSNNYDGNGNHPWNMWCEAFVEAVGQHAGYARHYYGSAASHANAVALRGGIGPAGASAFWSWDTDGHTAISIGDGTYIGTSSSGIQVYNPGLPYLGWAPPGVANGGFFPGNTPRNVLIGEGANDEIAAPIPMLQSVLQSVIDRSRSVLDGGLSVNFNGPVTINAQDADQARRSIADIGYAIKQDLRNRGLA